MSLLTPGEEASIKTVGALLRLLDYVEEPHRHQIAARLEVVRSECDQIAEDIDAIRRGEVPERRETRETVEQMTVGCFVEIDHEWLVFRGVDGFGRMALGRRGWATDLFYEFSDGELFNTEQPF